MFETSFFAEPKILLMGAITGFIFGFLLQKGHVTRFSTIVNQFLLKDFTVLKVMLTAIVIGSIGIYFSLETGLIAGLKIKKAALLGNALGAGIFAIGMVVLGYCPGTGVAAMADGARDAIFGVIGMLFGAAVYAEVYPWFKANILSTADIGKETLVSASGLSAWWFVAGITILAIIVFKIIEEVEKKGKDNGRIEIRMHQHSV